MEWTVKRSLTHQEKAVNREADAAARGQSKDLCWCASTMVTGRTDQSFKDRRDPRKLELTQGKEVPSWEWGSNGMTHVGSLRRMIKGGRSPPFEEIGRSAGGGPTTGKKGFYNSDRMSKHGGRGG